MRKIAIKYGLLMFAGFTFFFLIMHLLGQSQNYILRVFNGVIHLGLITFAIREYRKQNPDGISNHLSGVAMGIYTSVIGVVGFIIFMVLFLSGNTAFMASMKATLPLGEYLNPITASLYILVEGTAVSVIGSYILTRLVDMNLTEKGEWSPFQK